MSAAENMGVSHVDVDEVVNWDGEEPPDPDGDIPMTEDNNLRHQLMKVDTNAASSSTKKDEKTAKSSEDDLCPDCPATARGWRHKTSDCWKKHPEKRPASRRNNWRGGDSSQSEGNAAITTAGTNFMGMTVRKPVPKAKEDAPKTRRIETTFSATEDPFHGDVIVDLGCSNHYFNEKKWFTFFIDVKDAETMTTSNGGDLSVWPRHREDPYIGGKPHAGRCLLLP
ncbi:hypothetical protein BKA56DRAFT_737745 [Ilyonectria sp. MPI-CAGE-AT-0026]|nr:hypothetical protein BKA56DRAFT_737745 [Ilyonectria sp. MPI-CAGE-AT-0026]